MIVTCSGCGQDNRLPAPKLDRARCGRCKASLHGAPIAVGSEADFDELVRGAPLPVLVDFWAEWCGPCRMVAPEIERLARDRDGQVLVAKVDTEALPAVAARFSIRSIPTMVLFSGGRESKRSSGAMPASAIASTFGL